MVKGAPIGVFDSGVGGLSVLDEIQQLLPHESLLYVADGGHIPYGEKSPAFILQRSRLVAAFFRKQGAKAFVIACNTATVAAVADLRQDYPDWPLVGMEPAVKPAAAATTFTSTRRLATIARTPFAMLDPARPGYVGNCVLAPMVRSGELPTRLVSLKYGADAVWSQLRLPAIPRTS